MKNFKSQWILSGSVVAAVLGYLVGYYQPTFMLSLEFLGQLFQNGLTLLIAPLIVVSIVFAITSLGTKQKISRATLSTFLYFAGTTAIAVISGLILVLLFKPGAGIIGPTTMDPALLESLRSVTVSNFMESFLPSSLPGAVIGNNFLGIVILSFLFSAVLVTMGPKAKRITDLVETVRDLIFKLIEYLVLVLPVAIFVLVGSAVASNPEGLGRLLIDLSGYFTVVMVAFAFHALIVLPILFKLFTQQPLLKVVTRLIPAFTTAFATSSSTAALAITTDSVVKRCDIDKRAGSVVLPMGSVMNVDATAMYSLIGTIFVAQVFGVDLSFGQYLLITLTAIALSFGVSGIPKAALFIMFILFGIGGFPLSAYAGLGLIAAFDWFFDRIRALVNVWSDTVGAAIIGDSLDFKTASRQPARRYSHSDWSKPRDKRDREGYDKPKGQVRGRRNEYESNRNDKRHQNDRYDRNDQGTDSRSRSDNRPDQGRGGRPQRPNQRDDRHDRRPTRSPFDIADSKPTFDIDSKPVAAESKPKRRERTKPESAAPAKRAPRETVKAVSQPSRAVTQPSRAVAPPKVRQESRPTPERPKRVEREPVAESKPVEPKKIEPKKNFVMPKPPPLPYEKEAAQALLTKVAESKPEMVNEVVEEKPNAVAKPVVVEKPIPKPEPVMQSKPVVATVAPPVDMEIEDDKVVATPLPVEVMEEEIEPIKPAEKPKEEIESSVKKPEQSPKPAEVEKETEVATEAPTFGRKTNKRGAKLAKKETPPESSAPDEDSSFATEKQSFGRGTKKKPRR